MRASATHTQAAPLGVRTLDAKPEEPCKRHGQYAYHDKQHTVGPLRVKVMREGVLTVQIR